MCIREREENAAQACTETPSKNPQVGVEFLSSHRVLTALIFLKIIIEFVLKWGHARARGDVCVSEKETRRQHKHARARGDVCVSEKEKRTQHKHAQRIQAKTLS